MSSVGQVLFAFFEDQLKVQKGLRPGSVRSYWDALKIFLTYVATSSRRPITRLTLYDLSSERVLEFLSMIQSVRGNRFARETNGSPRFVPSTVTLPYTTPKCSPKPRGWKRFPRSEHHLPKRATWNAMRSTSCFNHFQNEAHWCCGIERSSCSSITPERACKRLPTCGLPMLPGGPATRAAPR